MLFTQFCTPGQARPQKPQLLWSEVVFTSHPSANAASQSANPGSQVPMWHTPATHVSVAVFGSEQMWPQVAQLFGSVAVSTSHPLFGFASQSV